MIKPCAAMAAMLVELVMGLHTPGSDQPTVAGGPLGTQSGGDGGGEGGGEGGNGGRGGNGGSEGGGGGGSGSAQQLDICISAMAKSDGMP